MRIRSGYSFRKAIGHLPDVLSRITEVGWTVAPITDTMSTFSFVNWTKACEKAGVRPIYGVEIGVVTEYKTKPSIDYWTFIAKDDLRPLHELVHQATKMPQPYLTYDRAVNAAGVFKITGSWLQTDRLPAELPDDLFFGHAPSNPIGLIKRAKRIGMQFVAVSDNVYPRAEDLEFYRLAMGPRFSSTQTYPQHILSWDEWLASTPEATDASIFNNELIAQGSTATLKKAKLFIPEKKATLREMCIAGAGLKNVDLAQPSYAERLDRELALIAEKGFEDYFYILADIVGWARNKMMVGPARGSSAGSLVCYLLDITTVDPIPHGLIFERFIDVNRADLPDIDVDFSDVQRSLALEYAQQRFGKEYVARLGTVGTFKPRSALVQIGTGLNVPAWKIDRVSEHVIEHAEGDERFGKSLEDTFAGTLAGQNMIEEVPHMIAAARLENHPNVPSQHAAGVLITDKPILEYTAVDNRTGAAWVAKKDAEYLNLLKVDALGLTQLAVFERTLELIGKPGEFRFFESLPIDDPAAFEVLNSRRFSGIFQFTGQALRRLASDVTFGSLDDIAALTALARPGPLGGGGAHTWIERKAGRQRVDSVHPVLDAILGPTFGVAVYQEQIMQIVRDLGGFSWADTSAIRRLVSLKLGEEKFMEYWPKFRAGASDKGMPEAVARSLWDSLRQFGIYAFNKSHSVAYGLVSYYCCWLKAHYPLQFAAATLDAETDPDKQMEILRELDREGIGYKPIDVDVSTDRWAINGNTIVGPLSSIKGIGPVKMRQIIDCRNDKSPLPAGLAKMLSQAKTPIDSLYPIADRVKALDFASLNIVTAPTSIIDIANRYHGEYVVLLGVAKRITPKDENSPDAVARRGRRVYGDQHMALNLFLADDTDEILCRVGRTRFDEIAKPIIERGNAGKALYAIRGNIVQLGFRMIDVTGARYLGDLE